MSETAFRAVCGKRRSGVWVDPGLGYTPFLSTSKRCKQCKGERANWPAELEIIDIKPEELDMGSKKTGSCDLCGNKAQLKHTERGDGLDICSACWNVLTAVNKTELMVRAIRLTGKTLEVAEQLGVALGAGDPADHAIAEAVRECFGRELSVEQLGLRCREEAEKAGRVAEELNLVRTLLARRDETIREIAWMLNYELVEPGAIEQFREIAGRIRDELGIDGREITAEEEIRGLVQEKLAADADLALREEELKRLREALKEANGRIVKLQDEGYEVWGALDGDVEECTLVELAEMRMKEIEALRAERKTTFVPPNGPMDEALLRWAITQYQQGKLQVNVEVREVAA